MPKVSICIPAYKQVRYLQKALVSVFSQDFEDFEVVITDDSPDDSVYNLLLDNGWLEKVRYIHNAPALGSPRNWNFGVSLAEGEYVKILHHDDWFLSPASLRAYVDLMESRQDVDFAFSASRVIDEAHANEWVHLCDEEVFEKIRLRPELLFCGNAIGAPSAAIFRKKRDTPRFDDNLKWLVDIDFYIACIGNSRDIAMTTECLIATPTNVEHQVTEICKGSAEIELFEYQYIFKKYSDKLVNVLKAKKFLRHIFERYRIWKISDLDQLGALRILNPSVFDDLEVRHFLTLKIRDRIVMHFPALYKQLVKFHVFRFLERDVF